LAAFGYDLGYLTEFVNNSSLATNSGYFSTEQNKELSAYNYIMDNLTNPLYVLLPFLGKLPTTYTTKMNAAIDTLDKLLQQFIDKARSERSNAATTSTSEQRNYTTLLELMVEATDSGKENNEANNSSNSNDNSHSSRLTDKELRDNCLVFFVAGHETTASVLTFALYALAKHPKVQQRLYEELLKHGPVDQYYNQEHSNTSILDQCEYLYCVIKEVLRMFPPAPMVQLRTNGSTEAQQIGPWLVPQNTSVSVSIYGMHHNEQYWERPYEFLPERFLSNPQTPEEKALKTGYEDKAFMPFGKGPRTCIGNRFSLLEQATFLHLFVNQFKVSLPKNADPNLVPFKPRKAITHPVDELSVVFEHRAAKQ